MATNSTVFNSLASGTVQAGGATPANVGLVAVSQTATITYAADGTTTSLFTIPAGSQILNINIDTTTAFNAGSSNTVSIGKSGAATQFVTATSVTSLGRQSVATTGAYANWANVGTSDVTVIATYNQTGTAASTGAARITIVYAF
jgi:hypothetical protein